MIASTFRFLLPRCGGLFLLALALGALPQAAKAQAPDPALWIAVGNYGCNQYYVSRNSYSWTEGDLLCRTVTNGHLVTIGDAGEDAFVRSISPERMWIGFTDRAQEGNWQWITGEPVTYTNWNAGEPNDLFGEDFAEINFGQGRWNDMNNDHTVRVVLEVEGQRPSVGAILGDTVLCEGATAVDYMATDFVNVDGIRWEVQGGAIVQQVTTNIIRVSWPEAQDSAFVRAVAVNSTTGCPGDTATAWVTVLPMPEVDEIIGAPSVCPRVEGVDYWVPDSADLQSIDWTVTGGTIAAQPSPFHIKVDWGETNFNAGVQVVPTHNSGCVGPAFTLPVEIFVELQTPTPVGDTLVCHVVASGQPYHVLPTNGSIYTWFAIGGSVVQGQGTGQVLVDWDGPGIHQLWLQEQSTTIDTVCFGVSDTLTVEVYEDNSSMMLDYVGWNSQDPDRLEVAWQGQETLPGTLDSLVVQVSPAPVGLDNYPVAQLTGSLVHAPLEPNDTVHTVRLHSRNVPCGLQEEWPPAHSPVWLSDAAPANDDEAMVTFTPYEGWNAVEYELWQQVDSGAWQLQGTYASAGTYENIDATTGFYHCFRVRAVQLGTGQASWSNIKCTNFEHPLFIPNVFTPNGDAYNPTFALKNLRLYPGSRLVLVDRWGRRVYATDDYQGDWAAEGLATGVYYFQLTVPAAGPHPAQSHHGTLSVLR